MSKIIVLVGPTGSGKTSLSIKLAKYYNASIINADSRYIYKECNIGTAKITEEEMEGIPHYLINVRSLNEGYTLYDYQSDARGVLDNLIKEDKNVIITGGSGLYIKALLYNYKLDNEEKNFDDFSDKTNEELKELSDSIYIDNNIHVNNRQRLVRFINHYNNTGNIIRNTEEKECPLYDFKLIGINIDRKTLYERINNRVDEMVNNGLIEEAHDLYQKKYNLLDTIIGYREFIPYFENKITKEEAVEQIKKDTRHYAKRQMTWFNNQMTDIQWFDKNTSFDEIIKFID